MEDLHERVGEFRRPATLFPAVDDIVGAVDPIVVALVGKSVQKFGQLRPLGDGQLAVEAPAAVVVVVEP